MKPGYKRTEVGIIPQDWDVMHVRDLVRQGPKNGYSARSRDNASGTATLSLAATSSGRLVLNDATVKHLEDSIPAGSLLFLETGDVLVQRSNTAELVGTTAIFDGPPATFVYPDLMMRLRFKDHQGPAREIHAGSGYCSQDSLTQVLATPNTPVSIWVRWPGGRETTTPIPEGTREITLEVGGKILSSK